MKHRYYTSGDYPELCKWWLSWGWDELPQEFLPETGIIISNGGVDICAAFLYRSDSKVCWVEQYIANKDAPKALRKGGLEFLIEQMMLEAKRLGFLAMVSCVKHDGLAKKLISAGCVPQYDSGMSHLVKVL